MFTRVKVNKIIDLKPLATLNTGESPLKEEVTLNNNLKFKIESITLILYLF